MNTFVKTCVLGAAVALASAPILLFGPDVAAAGVSRRAPERSRARQTTATPRGSGKTRFFDFDDLLIDGEFRKPATLYTRAMRSPRFDRLLRLQKSFLPDLLQSLRDPGLRWIR